MGGVKDLIWMSKRGGGGGIGFMVRALFFFSIQGKCEAVTGGVFFFFEKKNSR